MKVVVLFIHYRSNLFTVCIKEEGTSLCHTISYFVNSRGDKNNLSQKISINVIYLCI